MKTKILSLLLVLALVVAVSVFAVEASGTAFDEDSAVDGVVTAYCEACKQDVEWYPLEVSEGAVAFGENTHGYVPAAGLTTSASCTVGGEVCLYLNGTVTHSGSSALFALSTEATEKTDIIISVMGDAENGKIVSSASAPVFNLVKNTTGGKTGLHMYSGTVDAKDSTATRGAVICEYSDNVDTSELYMYGGTFYGSTTEKTKHGGAVYMAKGTFNMSDGTIAGSKIKDTSSFYGGNVYLAAGSTFIMSGGTIKDGHMTSATHIGAYGGNVAMGKNGSFTMTGGTIENGYANTYSSTSKQSEFKAYGGNLYFNEGCTVSISGKALITGGQARSKVAARGGNIFTASSAKVTISGNAQITNGKTILVNSGTTVTDPDTDKDTSTVSFGGNISFYGGTLNIQGGTISGGMCYNETKSSYTHTPCRGGNLHIAGGTTNITGGLFYNRNGSAVAWFGGNISFGGTTLNIDGENVEIVGGRAVHGGCIGAHAGTVNIKNGVIRGGTATKHGGAIHNHATMNMTGGKITDALESDGLTYITSQAESNGGAVYTAKTFTMDGANAVIEGGESNYGATIAIGESSYGEGYYGTFILKNGTINGGAATKQGGAIQVRNGGKCTISGGTVNPGTAGTNAAGLVVNSGGVLTITNGLTSRLDVFFDSSSIVDNKVSTDKVVVDGYTNGGMVVYERGGVKYPVVGSGTELILADAAVTNGDGEILAIPADAQAAVDAELGQYEYIKLYNTSTFALSKATIVDFNGNIATVTGGAEYLTGMDTATNDYKEDGAAVVSFTGTSPKLNHVADLKISGKLGQRKYLALDNGDGTYSFHRYYISMDKAGLRTDSNDGVKGPGISYSAVFRGDEAVVNAISAYGVAFTVLGNETKYAYTDALAATERNEGKMLAVHGMMNAEYGATPVSGKAYIVVNGETIYSTDAATNNLQALVETYAAQYSAAKLPDIFQTSVGAMLKKYAANMKAIGWNVPEVA